jgi:hypothetical protein
VYILLQELAMYLNMMSKGRKRRKKSAKWEKEMAVG